MAAATVHALRLGWLGRFDTGFFAAVGLITAEVVVLVTNRWTCPLTKIAERYTDDREPDFDIYLPKWIARHNIRIFTVIFIVGALAIAARQVLGGLE